ncbi:IS5 family transposase [Sinorhizobium meliloti]
MLRCALLKQYHQLSYEELAFHLEDCASFRAFARLPWGWSPKKVGLAQDDQRDAGGHLGSGRQNAAGQRPARKVGKRQGRACGQHRHSGADPRTKRQQSFVGLRAGDGSPSAAGGLAGQHHPLARSLPRGEEAGSGDRVYPRPPETGSALPRSAQDRPEHLDYLQQAAAQLPLAAGPAGKLWQAQLRHYQPLITQIIAQTERRVLAGEKLVSLFERERDEHPTAFVC